MKTHPRSEQQVLQRVHTDAKVNECGNRLARVIPGLFSYRLNSGRDSGRNRLRRHRRLQREVTELR